MLDKPVLSVILVGPGGLAQKGDACLWLACDLPSPGSPFGKGGTSRRDFIGVWSTSTQSCPPTGPVSPQKEI
jgi:hypothetical protein